MRWPRSPTKNLQSFNVEALVISPALTPKRPAELPLDPQSCLRVCPSGFDTLERTNYEYLLERSGYPTPKVTSRVMLGWRPILLGFGPTEVGAPPRFRRSGGLAGSRTQVRKVPTEPSFTCVVDLTALDSRCSPLLLELHRTKTGWETTSLLSCVRFPVTGSRVTSSCD